MMLQLSLPSIPKILDDLVSFLFKSITEENADLVQASFQALSVIIMQYEKFLISKTQISALIGFIRNDIDESRKQSVVFGLINVFLFLNFILY